jgi:hypothetical protein
MPASHAPSVERPRNWVATLRQFVRAPTIAIERCELCGQSLAPAHPHFLEPESRRFVCACASCAGDADSGAASRYRRIPGEIRWLHDFRMSEAQWDALRVPIGLAFFFKCGDDASVRAVYPGAAGAVESTLDLSAWQALESANPSLKSLRPDIEALLVHRIGEARDCYLAPIDRCFALAGLVKSQWHGISGGSAVGASVAAFFCDLQAGGASSLGHCSA